MVTQTNEQALEAAIETQLTGRCLEETPPGAGPAEEFREKDLPFGKHHGYQPGYPTDFNPRYAIDETRFWAFLSKTQPKELEKLQRLSAGPEEWRRKVLKRFDRLIKKYGLLHLLKKGLRVDDAHLTLMYPAPLASSSEAVTQNFAENIFSSTRQVHYSLANPLEEIDLVLFINGLPIATLELKNPWTGQTARYHGQKQYRDSRDITQPLLQFGRGLVHMAVDTDEVYMTTRLAGKSTFFLPFNKGHNFGAGNPPNAGGQLILYTI